MAVCSLTIRHGKLCDDDDDDDDNVTCFSYISIVCDGVGLLIFVLR